MWNLSKLYTVLERVGKEKSVAKQNDQLQDVQVTKNFGVSESGARVAAHSFGECVAMFLFLLNVLTFWFK